MSICLKVLENISIAKLYSRKTGRGSYSKEDIVRAVDLVKRIKHPPEVLLKCVVLNTKLCRDTITRDYALEENGESLLVDASNQILG